MDLPADWQSQHVRAAVADAGLCSLTDTTPRTAAAAEFAGRGLVGRPAHPARETGEVDGLLALLTDDPGRPPNNAPQIVSAL